MKKRYGPVRIAYWNGGRHRGVSLSWIGRRVLWNWEWWYELKGGT